MKHFTFDSGESENRDVNNSNDDNAEKHRGPNLFTGIEDGVYAFVRSESACELMLFLADAPDNVFHDHHRAVYEEPEIDCAQTHQVARDSESRHAGKSEE